MSQTMSSRSNSPLRDLSRDELIVRMRLLESRAARAEAERGNQSKRIHELLQQTQALRSRVNEITRENMELRSLACFLDDERRAARDLAREWREFGSGVGAEARQQWAEMAWKLQQLESKQFELVRDNCELKQLCLLLDSRDTSQHIECCSPPPTGRPHVLTQQILAYIRSLESRVREVPKSGGGTGDANNNSDELLPHPPTAVSEAMRVLHVHDADGATSEEKAIVHALCNVALRKLEDEA